MTDKMPYGLRFSLIGRTFKQRLDEQLSAEELTGVQMNVLKELGRLEHSGVPEVNQRDLENANHVTHPTMTQILKRLERKGFISCCQSSIDRRSKSISSTEKVMQLRHELGKIDQMIFKQLCQGLDQEQIDTVLTALNIMLDNAFQCHDDSIHKKGCEKLDQTTCEERTGI